MSYEGQPEAAQPDDSEPSPERQTAITKQTEVNMAEERAPYAGVHIRTRGELRWVARREGRTLGVIRYGEEPFNLSQADFSHANLAEVNLKLANLSFAYCEQSNFAGADLTGADLHGTNLSAGSTLAGALLVGANLSGAGLGKIASEALGITPALGYTFPAADLSGAQLRNADLSGTNLDGACLRGVDLRGSRLDDTTVLGDAILDSNILLADVRWKGVGLTQIDWNNVTTLGDEHLVKEPNDSFGNAKHPAALLREYEAAVRAYRQLAVELRNQGLNEPADRFAYRAQVVQRQVLRRHRHHLRAFSSWLLDMIAGYGYRPMRTVIAYVVIILLFAGLYLLNPQFATPHLKWDEALVLSVSSFHGRGFFTSGISLGDNLARLAAVEAIIGLLIEIVFIATFTQRFFAR